MSYSRDELVNLSIIGKTNNEKLLAADLMERMEIAEKAIALAAKWEKEAAVYHANIEEAEAKGLPSNEMRGHKTQLLACAKDLRMIEKARGE